MPEDYRLYLDDVLEAVAMIRKYINGYDHINTLIFYITLCSGYYPSKIHQHDRSRFSWEPVGKPRLPKGVEKCPDEKNRRTRILLA